MKKNTQWVIGAVVLIGVVLGGGHALAETVNVTENPSPVFSTLIPDQAYVIKDAVNYKLYYAGNDFASINLATSPDGITWSPYVGNPVLAEGSLVQGEHADVHFYASGFGGANSGTNPSALTMYYRMWYQGAVPGIGAWRYAESPDGISWYNRQAINQFGIPVFSAQTGAAYGIADAVYTPGASNTGTDWAFRMYVNVQWEVAPYGGNELVLMAFSANGYDWTGYDPTSVGYATPVFEGTLHTGDFDRDHIGWFKVIKNSSTDWEAFYSGGTDTTYQNLNGIGYVTSTDGITWTRKKTLFTTNDSVAWRAKSVWMPSVVKTGINTYSIWFLGSDNPSIGSSDWIQWKVGMANIVKTTTSSTTTPSGTITVINTVINDSGGTKAVADFPLFVNGIPVISGVANTISVPPDQYFDTVTETTDPNYVESFSGDCDASGLVNLNPGYNKVCIITNNDKGPVVVIPPATLHVIKHVINDSGGISTASMFTVRVQQNGHCVVGSPAPGQEAPGNTYSLAPNAYIVSEDTNTSYAQSFSGDCDASGNITLASGDNKTCILTNNDIVPGAVPPAPGVPGITPTVSRDYCVAEALAASPTITIDKSLTATSGAAASSCTSGKLIKLANDRNSATQFDSTVYYCGIDGKRYVFPDVGTYHSWYPDYSGVSIIMPSELVAIPIGGNVTYRPGVRMLKITTDPKVNAVAKGGVLRWITSEVTAVALYGQDWKKMISDISDAFFSDYTIGDPITYADVTPGSTPPASLCTATGTFTSFLTLGSTDIQVRSLQKLLQCLGYFPTNVAPTGIFGPTTVSAVKEFQSAHGVQPAGYVGPATRAQLNHYTHN